CDEFLSREEALALYDAIADLPERSRNILVGRELAGLPYEQLAEWDGASVHGLRCLTSRAKADLRDLYLVEARKRRLAALAPLIQLPRRLCRRLRDKTTDLGALTPLLPGVANLAFVTAVALVGSQSWDSSRAMAFAAPSPGRSIVLIAADQPTPEVQPASDDLRPSGGRSRGTEQAPVQLALHRGYGQSGIDSHVGGDIGGLGGETNGHDAFVCSGGVVAGLACQVLAQLPAPPAE
ncbi:MAG: hypothetical protein QOD39_4129, partial [Mycobacterium sp.]|nr:hypothetical protein [Mycobacterium sp.]